MDRHADNEATHDGHPIDRWALLGLLVVCALALVLRLHRLGAESLWMDEARQVSYYGLPLRLVVLKACRQAQPPLDYLIGAGLHRLGLADGDGWVRLPAVLFGAGGVFLLGWLTCRIAGPVAGITAAVLLALSPLHVMMSQEARPYAIFFFFALATVLLFSHARRRDSFRCWSAFGLAFLGMLMTRGMAPHVLTLCFVVPAAGMWAVGRRSGVPGVRARETHRLGATAMALAMAYAVFNPILGIIYLSNMGFLDAPSTPWLGRAGRMLTNSFSAILIGPATVASGDMWISLLEVGVAGLAVLGSVLMLRRVGRPGARHGLSFAVVLVPFPLLYAVAYTTSTGFVPKPQYLLLMAAPVFAGTAIAADALRRRLSSASSTAAWLAFAGLVCAVGRPWEGRPSRRSTGRTSPLGATR